MAIKTPSVTVTTTATLIAAQPRTALDDVHWVEVVVPAGGSTVYLGGPDVTTGTGRPLAPSASAEASWAATLGGDDNLYGIVASGSQAVRVLRSRMPS